MSNRKTSKPITNIASVTATDLARSTSTILNRVIAGERLFVIKGSKVIAVIEPTDFKGFVK